MTQTIYIIIILFLISVIISLIGKINTIKKEHRMKLSVLYKTLSELSEKEKDNNSKITLENNLNEKISDAKKKLNADIFELQMNLFKKITEN